MKMDYEHIKGPDYDYYTVPALLEAGLEHRFIGKPLNFKPDFKEASVDVVNRTFLKADMPLVEVHQVHGADICQVRAGQLGTGWGLRSLGDYDGLVTEASDLALMVKIADCIPIILFDPVKKVFALVHSGWPGTLQAIGQKALEVMMSQYDVRPSDLLIAYGPALSMEDFQVQEDVYSRFQPFEAIHPQAFRQEDEHHWLIDTKGINQERFLAMGVPLEQQYDVAVSTKQALGCHSYRRDGREGYGLNAVVAYLKS